VGLGKQKRGLLGYDSIEGRIYLYNIEAGELSSE